jgi:hypothetical protein
MPTQYRMGGPGRPWVEGEPGVGRSPATTSRQDGAWEGAQPIRIAAAQEALLNETMAP